LFHGLVKLNLRHLLLTAEAAKRILRGEDRISLDLGLSESVVNLQGGSVIFPDGSKVELESLCSILKRPDTVFMLLGSELSPVSLSNSHYYKLAPTSGAPTLEIDGVRMHRTKGTTPEADAMEKVRVLGIRGGLVLEIGTGLGYTAQAAVNAGADSVFSVELSPAVLKIAVMNPWSRRTFIGERIHIVLGDAYDIVRSLRSGLFDYMIHDPPRFSLAGHLYGTSFYAELFRVLKKGGRLFHYVGEPGSRYRGRNLREGVANRLREVGFVKGLYHEAVKGLTCMKP
jgi:predicted methyltransferase